MNIKNLMWLLFLLGAAMLTQTSVRAEIGLGEIWGTAWTVKNAIWGETTLTPAYAVETWTYRFKEVGLGPGTDGSITKKMWRNRITGDHIYYTKIQSVTSPVFPESNDPFMMTSINKINMTCKHDVGGGTIVTDTTLETHTEWVWLAKVESTGILPDNGPWTVWLKTSGYGVGCDPRTPVSRHYWTPATLTKSAGQVVSLGVPSCVMDWPFYVANEFYN